MPEPRLFRTLVALLLLAAGTAGCDGPDDDADAMSAAVSDVRLGTAPFGSGSAAREALAPPLLRGSDAMAALLAASGREDAPIELETLRDAAEAVRRATLLLPVPSVVLAAPVAAGALDDVLYAPDRAVADRRAFCALGRWAFAVEQALLPPQIRPGSAEPRQVVIDDGERHLVDLCR